MRSLFREILRKHEKTCLFELSGRVAAFWMLKKRKFVAISTQSERSLNKSEGVGGGSKTLPYYNNKTGIFVVDFRPLGSLADFETARVPVGSRIGVPIKNKNRDLLQKTLQATRFFQIFRPAQPPRNFLSIQQGENWNSIRVSVQPGSGPVFGQ